MKNDQKRAVRAAKLLRTLAERARNERKRLEKLLSPTALDARTHSELSAVWVTLNRAAEKIETVDQLKLFTDE